MLSVQTQTSCESKSWSWVGSYNGEPLSLFWYTSHGLVSLGGQVTDWSSQVGTMNFSDFLWRGSHVLADWLCPAEEGIGKEPFTWKIWFPALLQEHRKAERKEGAKRSWREASCPFLYSLVNPCRTYMHIQIHIHTYNCICIFDMKLLTAVFNVKMNILKGRCILFHFWSRILLASGLTFFYP